MLSQFFRLWIKNKFCFPLPAVQLVQIPSHHHRPFSSQKLRQPTQSRSLDKALRVLDIIAPQTNGSSSRKTHLRLIQDFLQTDSNQFTPQRYGDDDFDCSEGISNVIDEILECSILENESGTRFDFHGEGLRVDASVLYNAVSSCGSSRDLRSGVGYHCLALTTGFVSNVYVGSSLISLYSKCGELDNAYKVFEEMPVRNVVSWTAIIAGFAHEWHVDVCLELYHRMMRDSTSKPNDFTFSSLLSACTGSGALGQGQSAHCQTIQMGFDSYLHIANALISMYCKCGSVEDAFYLFSNLPYKDTVSWNSMIAGYAQNGLAAQSIDLFKEMNKQRVKPDAITFLGVLSSCRHAGLVEQGQMCFDSMNMHGLKPELDHYSCVVDLLGRAGLVEEARDFIERMPIRPNAVIWGSLLSSCRLHGNVWIGIQAAESRLLLEPGCVATHVQLANLYARAGHWALAARVRKLMKDKGLKTNPGYSWIEIKNKVYTFRAEDRSNTSVIEIVAVVDCLVDHMTTLGYVLQPEMQEEEVDDIL